MKPITQIIEKRPWMAWLIFLVTIVVVFLVGLLASSVIERRAEAVFVNVPKTQISQFEPRNEVWGENFPREFQSYYQTADTSFVSKYDGNKPIDMLKVDPRMVVLWAGYAFSKDYNQGRGHFMLLKMFETFCALVRLKMPTTDRSLQPAGLAKVRMCRD